MNIGQQHTRMCIFLRLGLFIGTVENHGKKW